MKQIKYSLFLIQIVFIFSFIDALKIKYSNVSNLKDYNPNSHIRIESNIDPNSYDESKNETVFASEKTLIKYWKAKKKEALQEKIENQINYNADANVTLTSDNFSFYNQLNSNEKQIYDILYEKSAKSPPELKIKIVISEVTDINAFIDELIISAEKIFTVLSYENPKLWWIGSYQFYLVSSQKRNQYIVTFDTIPDYSTFYGYSSNEIMVLNQKVEKVKDEIMNNIAKYKVTTPYAILRYIHDYLITNIIYILDENKKHIRTLYGALVEKECVCEGYSEAFQYLAHQYGINCITARSSSHEWNFVEMNGKWYVVDLTYDDPLINGKNTPLGSKDNLKTDYFLIGTETEIPYSTKYSEDPNHFLIYSGFSDKELISYPYIEDYNYIPSELEIQEVESMGLTSPRDSIIYINKPNYFNKNYKNDGISMNRFKKLITFYNFLIILFCVQFII